MYGFAEKCRCNENSLIFWCFIIDQMQVIWTLKPNWSLTSTKNTFEWGKKLEMVVVINSFRFSAKNESDFQYLRFW